jgi:hypothetical protein
MQITKAKLIKMLEEFPDDSIILVEGYENGFDAIAEVTETQARHLPNAEDWDGEFVAESTYQKEKDHKPLMGSSPYRDASESSQLAIFIKGRRGNKRRNKS